MNTLTIVNDLPDESSAYDHDSPGPRPRGAEPGRSEPRASLSGFMAWARKRFHLVPALEKVPDGRCAERVQIPLPAVLLAVLLMFWLGLPSIRALEDRLNTSAGLRRVASLAGWGGGISDDTFEDALERLGLDGLRDAFHCLAKRELKRWRAGRFRQSELAVRLSEINKIGCASLVVRALVGIDGHELFRAERRSCPICLTRKVRKARDGETVEVQEHYHRVVVAQWLGTHPAIVFDFEEQRPGENELAPALRLIQRLARVYGLEIGTIVADAFYDVEPFRQAVQKAGYHWLIRQKDQRRGTWMLLKRRIDARDPERQVPQQCHRDPYKRQRYDCWYEAECPGSISRRYVEFRRTDASVNCRPPELHTGACVTDLPAKDAPAVAVAMMMQARWGEENTGFHELAGEWNLDRAFVHAGRPTAASAIVALGLMAYNAMQAFVYRYLRLDPWKPRRTIGDIKRDLFETLVLFSRRAMARAP